MRIVHRTRVSGNYREIMKRFDRDLFEALMPQFGKAEIVEFTGSKEGDKVHLRFIFPLKAEWVSAITEDGVSEEEAFFVDEGTTLPVGITYWRHRHVARRIDETTTEIVDDINFRSWFFLTTFLLYPVLWLAFYPRGGVYRSYFGESKEK